MDGPAHRRSFTFTFTCCPGGRQMGWIWPGRPRTRRPKHCVPIARRSAANSFDLPGRVAELPLESLLDFVRRKLVILATAVPDLDGTEQRAQATRAWPIPSVCDTVKESRAVGVAATGRVENFARFDDR